MTKANALKPGGMIGLIATSTRIAKPETIDEAARALHARGYRVRIGAHARDAHGYFCGDDQARANDFMRMFLDPEVDAIVCLRGGYGAERILPLIDFDAVRAHPKPFVGYSDVTALSLALFAHAGLITLHGAMALTAWANTDDAFSEGCLMRALTSTEPLGEIQNPPGYGAPVCHAPGRARGRLLGGNLSLFTGACGTKYMPDLHGAILLIEEVNEKCYRVDHMFTQLRNNGVFEACAGVVLGEFTNCEMEDPAHSLTVPDIVREVIAPAGKPILGGYSIGHVKDKLTVPIGAMCAMDADAGTLQVLEAAFV